MRHSLETIDGNDRPARCCFAIRASGTDLEVNAYRTGDDLVVVMNDARGAHVARVVLRDFLLHAARNTLIGDIVLVPEPTFPASDQT